jgi:hypothetical protein
MDQEKGFIELNEYIFEYLSGKKLDSGFKLKIEKYTGTKYDVASLTIEKIKNKSVIHLGCADHLDLIMKKIRNNTWFHKILTENSAECIGLDINREAVEYIRNNTEFLNVYYCDILNGLPNNLSTKKWDYLVAGEVLEHISNPSVFLEDIRVKYSGIIEKILITVPNALRIENFKFALRNIECVNSDHYYWFTPYTLAKVVYRAGYKINEIYLATKYIFDLRARSRLKYYLLKRFPLLRDTIILEANF